MDALADKMAGVTWHCGNKRVAAGEVHDLFLGGQSVILSDGKRLPHTGNSVFPAE